MEVSLRQIRISMQQLALKLEEHEQEHSPAISGLWLEQLERIKKSLDHLSDRGTMRRYWTGA